MGACYGVVMSAKQRKKAKPVRTLISRSIRAMLRERMREDQRSKIPRLNYQLRHSVDPSERKLIAAEIRWINRTFPAKNGPDIPGRVHKQASRISHVGGA